MKGQALVACLLAALLVQVQCGEDGTKGCPSPKYAPRAPAGCPCDPQPASSFGRCGAGYVCAERWVMAAAADGSRRRLQGDAAPSPASPQQQTKASGHHCERCSLGQYCPEGSGLTSPAPAHVNTLLKALNCPAGHYCPTPSEMLACPAGEFCDQGSTQPVTCNMTELIAEHPTMLIHQRPATVYERVYVNGDQLAGNYCPANSSAPNAVCKAGFYCPEPGMAVTCPAGYYCKAGSSEPSSCPVLTSCPEGSAKANLSWVGFVALVIVMVVLVIAYALAQSAMLFGRKRQMRTQEARDRLWNLLHPILAPSHAQARSRGFRAFKGIRPRLNIEFQNLGLKLLDGTSIIEGVTGRFCHSRLTAIMGPSGAGKSTFLNVVMGRANQYQGHMQGAVKVNGRSLRLSALRSITGFVPQDDIVHDDLTVRENLVYNALLRLSKGKPHAEKMAVVEDVIDVLQLRRVQHQVVGCVERRGISGGQRKRVNIGWELCAKPSVLFMDEPTSGLDATAAWDIIQALRRMADLGMNLVGVIHQPRYAIFTLFDDVMLLGRGGRLVYLGPSHLALCYFESLSFALPANENPSDFLMDVISGSVERDGCAGFQPEELVGLWQAYGTGWVALQEKLEPAEERAALRASASETPRLDPEQLALLEEAFDAAVADGDSALDAAMLRAMFVRLGLEPSAADVRLVMAELADPRTGLITREAFMQYVRYGGRPPAEAVPSSRRRHDSMYRTYSIEQYTLASAMSELGALQLPGGLRPGASFKEAVAALAAEGGAPPEIGAAALSPAPGEQPALPTVAEEAEEEEQQHASAGARASPDATDCAPAPRGRRPPRLWITNSARDGSPVQTDVPLGSPAASVGSETPVAIHIAPGSPGVPGAFSYFSPSPPESPGKVQRYDTASTESLEQLTSEQEAAMQSQPRAWRRAAACACAWCHRGAQLRATPALWTQWVLLTARSGIKWMRSWNSKLMDVFLLIFAAVVTGSIHGTGWGVWDVRPNTALILLGLGIISTATSLSLFGRDRVVFWREKAAGIGALPYFLANTAVQIIDIVVQPLIFVAVYYSMTLPAISFMKYYGIGLLVVWWCTSLASLLSVLVSPQNVLVVAIAVVMVFGGFVNGVTPPMRNLPAFMKGLAALSYNRWMVEATTIWEFQEAPQYLWPLTRAAITAAGYCGLGDDLPLPGKGSGGAPIAPRPSGAGETLDIGIYCAGYARQAVLITLVEGIVLRVLAYLALEFMPRGLRLEPLVLAVSAGVKRVRAVAGRWWRARAERKGARAAAAAVAPAAAEEAQAGTP